MIFLETERLRLRNVEEKDADIIYDYRNNETCAKYQHGQLKDKDRILELLERRKEDSITANSPCMLAVAFKSNDEIVGEIIIKPKDKTIFLGYTFSYKHHRKGYAFEALNSLIDMIHRNYPDMNFICFTEPENIPSIKLLEKLGYKDMGYSEESESLVFGKFNFD